MSQAKSLYLLNTLQSLFRFEEGEVPWRAEGVDVSKISQLNFKQVKNLAIKADELLKNEWSGVNQQRIADIHQLMQVALDYLEWESLLLERRLEDQTAIVKKYSSFSRKFGFTSGGKAVKRHQGLNKSMQTAQAQYIELKELQEGFNRTIRKVALSMAKSELPANHIHYVENIENLERALDILNALHKEIKRQMTLVAEHHRIMYYESERQRFYNMLQETWLTVKQIPFLLSKARLDSAFLTSELVGQLDCSERITRWYVSDMAFYKQFASRHSAVRLIIEGLEVQLKPHSHRLNQLAAKVDHLGALLMFEGVRPAEAQVFKAKAPSQPKSELKTKAVSTNKATPQTEPVAPKPQLEFDDFEFDTSTTAVENWSFDNDLVDTAFQPEAKEDNAINAKEHSGISVNEAKEDNAVKANAASISQDSQPPKSTQVKPIAKTKRPAVRIKNQEVVYPSNQEEAGLSAKPREKVNGHSHPSAEAWFKQSFELAEESFEDEPILTLGLEEMEAEQRLAN